MRSLIVLAAVGLSATAVFADEKCTSEVRSAFEKQATAAKMRTVMTHPGGEGTVTRTITLVRPNRMHAITEAPHEAAGRIETISIGQWAWGSDSDGAWSEHKPNVARMIEVDVQAMAGPQAVAANFTCLGKVAYEGKEYTGYRADPGKGDDGVELAAIIYVDASGMPAFNIVAPTAEGGAPRLKAVYTYGDDISVEPPPGFGIKQEAPAASADVPQKN